MRRTGSGVRATLALRRRRLRLAHGRRGATRDDDDVVTEPSHHVTPPGECLVAACGALPPTYDLRMSCLAGSSTRGQSSLVLTAVLVLTFSAGTGGARPALAHEFRLALVTPASGTANTGLSGTDVRDGFRLAVDRSPDVSHPAGADAGDHLGGVDVDVSVIEGTEAAGAAEAVKEELDAGLTAVVVIASAPTARAVTTELEGFPVLVVTATGAGASAPADAGALQLRQRPGPPFESAVAVDVAAAFEQAYGRDLSASAALGYDAGRLLDAAIAGADGGVEDLGSVVAAGSAVDDVLVSADAEAPDRTTAEPAPAALPAAAADSGTGRLWPILAVGAVAVLALLTALLGWRASSRRRAG